MAVLSSASVMVGLTIRQSQFWELRGGLTAGGQVGGGGKRLTNLKERRKGI